MPKIDPLDSSAITRVVAVCVFLGCCFEAKDETDCEDHWDRPGVGSLRLERDPVCSACTMTWMAGA